MGKVIVVGIGPGSYEDMTIRADRALRGSDAIVGYGVYVDLVKERYPDKAFYETPMTQEAKRCALALDLARAGDRKSTRLNSSHRSLSRMPSSA